MKKHKKNIILTLAITSFAPTVLAHGYVSEINGGIAGSRAYFCKYPASDTNEKNTNCGPIQYEPQSLEASDGFPAAGGPPDGKIASAGIGRGSALDEQTADRWIKRPIKAGKQTFEWTHTANHVTRDWRYYITKPNWNPTDPLSRDSFDLKPFCVVDGNMVQPPKEVHHECNVPEREGYQVILSVWDIGDTANAFYQVIDVKFDGNGPSIPEWEKGGQIYPAINLKAGESVYTRVFDQSGENNAYRTELNITSDEQGKANNWSHALAKKINSERNNIRAGQYVEGDFNPAYGSNPIYLKTDSGLERVEIDYTTTAPEPDASMTITGLADSYQIDDEPTSLYLTLSAEGDVDASLTVYNHEQQPLANWAGEISDGNSEPVTLTLDKSEPGHHMLIARIKDSDGNLVNQKTLDFQLEDDSVTPPSGDYDFVFPKGVSNYTEGTKVLASDGNIYQCKAFPYSGYCSQWSTTARQYEPATGSHWQMAWTKQ